MSSNHVSIKDQDLITSSLCSGHHRRTLTVSGCLTRSSPCRPRAGASWRWSWAAASASPLRRRHRSWTWRSPPSTTTRAVAAAAAGAAGQIWENMTWAEFSKCQKISVSTAPANCGTVWADWNGLVDWKVAIPSGHRVDKHYWIWYLFISIVKKIREQSENDPRSRYSSNQG